jgi:hypothetical protein
MAANATVKYFQFILVVSAIVFADATILFPVHIATSIEIRFAISSGDSGKAGSHALARQFAEWDRLIAALTVICAWGEGVP